MALNPASDGICYHGLFEQIDYVRFVQEKAERTESELPTPQLGTQDQLHVWSEHFLVDDFYKKHPGALLFRGSGSIDYSVFGKAPSTGEGCCLTSRWHPSTRK